MITSYSLLPELNEALTVVEAALNAINAEKAEGWIAEGLKAKRLALAEKAQYAIYDLIKTY